MQTRVKNAFIYALLLLLTYPNTEVDFALCSMCSWIIVRPLEGRSLCVTKTKCTPRGVNSDSAPSS